ncbi:MAG: PBS lyase [Desulfobacterales bacterium]|nr:MAG: PBS lyase [Desulfobacterales bacterium]
MSEKVRNTPWCPFCGAKVGRPVEATERKLNEFPVGSCSCGAVFACDATGHNVGAALVESLVHACNDNWDFAWELLPEEDYLTGRIENYDDQLHEVCDKGNVDGRQVRGVLYFVRLHTEIAELSRRIKEKKTQGKAKKPSPEMLVQNRPATEPVRDKSTPRKKANKRMVKKWVEEANIDELVSLCLDDKKTLRLMQRQLYAPNDELRWHVVWVIGQTTARVATRDPGQVSELLHRLFEACNDSAAAHWGMVETMGSVIAARPDIFGSFTRYLLNFANQDSTRAHVVWAMAEIAAVRPDLVRETPFFSLFHMLRHPDPVVRGLMARLLGRLRATEAAMQLLPLTSDETPILICEDGKLIQTTVAAEAKQAVAVIHGEKNE